MQFKKLAARKRHVNFFLGAGASRACGLPDIGELRTQVLSKLASDPAGVSLFDCRTLEQGLTRLRKIRSLLSNTTTIEGLDQAHADELDERICASISAALDLKPVDLVPYQQLAAWTNQSPYHLPVEIFTVNYDLLLERGLESESVLYFDGYVGSLEARFRADLVDQIEPGHPDSLPASCVRLWKLHGSLNWAYRESDDGKRFVVRLGSPASESAAIFPSDDKYDDSRRVPFVVLMDRLRRALSVPESLTIVSGYSFSDQHLNESFFEASRTNPRSELYVLCYGDVPAAVQQAAEKYRNIVVHARKTAIIGGRELQWEASGDIAGIFEGGDFLLGGFKAFTSTLIRDTGFAENT